jgi:autotransporter-associated beta strand protein
VGGSGTQLQGDNSAGGENMTYTIGGANANTEFDGVIKDGTVGTVALTKIGTGTLTLTGVNAFSGNLTNSAGTLAIGGAGQLGGGSYAGIITNNAALVFGSTAAQTLSGVISGSGALTLNGPGTLTLTGTNTYRGGTTVNGGLLLLNTPGRSATGSGAVIVNDGGTLGRTGVISGPVTINAGGALAPGNPLGTLTISNNLTLAAGSTTFAQIYKVVSTPALTNSMVTITGTLTEGGTLNVTNIGVVALASGDSFKLFNATSYSGSFAGFVLPPLTGNLVWYTNTLASSGTLSVVTLTAPTITGITIAGGQLTLSGSGGLNSWPFMLLASTNLTAAEWTPVATNQFNTSGNFSLTNTISPNSPQMFYKLQVQ